MLVSFAEKENKSRRRTMWKIFSYQGSGTFLGLGALGRLVQETGSLFNDMTCAPVHQKESSPCIWTEFWGPC